MDSGAGPARVELHFRGAVSRVSAVGRLDGAPAVDPARSTDPHDPAWPRPDPARIAIGDIIQFQTLVYGTAGPAYGSPDGLPPPAQEAAEAVSTAPGPDALPADRINHTLRRLGAVPGL